MVKKGSKKLINTLKGIIASKIYKLANKNSISLEDALKKYINDLPKKSRMRNYDILADKDEIIAKAKSKMSNGLAKIPTKSKAKSSSNTQDAEKEQLYAKPDLIKIKGEAKLVESEEGYYVERTDKTKMVGLKCPSGTTAKKIDNNRAGCGYNQNPRQN
jgi:hypothetical protein